MEKSESQSSFWKQKKSSKPNLFKKGKKGRGHVTISLFLLTIIALKKERKNIASKMKSRSYYYDNAGYGVSSPDTKLVRFLSKINVFRGNFSSLSFKLNDSKFFKKWEILILKMDSKLIGFCTSEIEIPLPVLPFSSIKGQSWQKGFFCCS